LKQAKNKFDKLVKIIKIELKLEATNLNLKPKNKTGVSK
jgi:hypothetical protein